MKRISHIFLPVFLILLSGALCFSQHVETNLWYFGIHAGLDFSSGTPVAINGGQTNSYEGCTVMSDRNNGQLLFYSDGGTVWDRMHDSMPNGKGLWGHPSATQSSLAVPNPANGNQYFLFTVATQAGYYPMGAFSGGAYSVIDMTLNGELGDVIPNQKNIQLLDSTTEKLAAVQHCNGRDYWVVFHRWNSDAFYSYLISPSGVSPPVVSNVGTVIQNYGSTNQSETIGYMKFSPDGKHLAMASFSPMNSAQSFDFDASTGIISNVITLNIPVPPPNGYGGPYGVSFSPDGNLLYVGWHDYFNRPNYILQYNISLGTEVAIQASRTVVGSGLNVRSFGAFQLATNGKLYVTTFNQSQTNPIGSLTIGAINSPNTIGTSCGWSPTAVSLDSGRCIWGLPNFVESSFSSQVLSLGPDLYLWPPISVTLDAGPGFSSYLWSDGSSMQTMNATSAGTYWVSVINQNGCTQTDTLHIYLPLSVRDEATFSGFNVSYSEVNSVQISFNSLLSQDFSVSIYSMDGKRMFNEYYNHVIGLFKLDYHLNFSKGIYILNLQGKNIAKNVKLIVR
ncbi:MAG: T9SS type A sorting domain-containing protein [Bacteroidia bacterium]|nr:T9SS type A sorting domain-containing protein [Bacteroidia bacterium]